ncbi:hypothetical protein AB0368_05660 [Actinoplanes sp. NPDC051475]|uniref:hypothetical protein n=1 Tax=Actinoplanes sp. NPDC051475 TaxID=3157225 RepID=UPI003450E0B4
MTRAVPVSDDLAQPARPARSLRSWMTGVPAIVTFGRGLRLGMLAARSGRASETAAASQASEAAAASWASEGAPANQAAEATTASQAFETAAITPACEFAEVDPAAAIAEPASAAAAGSGRRGRKVAAAGAAGVVGMLIVPLPASAAPAPCEQAERYSAQSGSQILRLTELRVGPNASKKSGAAGKSGNGPSTASGGTEEVHVGEAKSAMVAQASISSAAVARMIDAGGDETPGELSEAVQQQAPPTNAEAERRSTGAADVGPVSLGAGAMTTHARWEAGMACGATVGDVTRATARLRDAGIGADGDTALVRVPGKVESESTTKLERRGSAAATVATAGLQGGDLELLDGAVEVNVIKAPSLRASMSIQDGGEVRYIPAVVEVSGRGFKTERLSTAGDDIVITYDDSAHRSAPESAPTGLLGKLPVVGGPLNSGDALPLPEVPGLPEVAPPSSEAVPVGEPGTRVRISLGDVRQASRGRAIAARAAALSVTITHGSSDGRTEPGYAESVAFDMGVLEAAAVAPESAGGVSAGGVSAGEAGGLPITGPRVDVIALSGVALLIAGAAALIFGLRGRSRS